MTIQWNDSFKIGDAEIDAQHQRLFAIINRFLEAVGDAEVKRTAMSLYEYTREHFDHEERLMRRIKYPEVSAHVGQHNLLISQLNAVSLKIADGTLVRQQLESFVAGWLDDHIKNYDLKLAAYMPADK